MTTIRHRLALGRVKLYWVSGMVFGNGSLNALLLEWPVQGVGIAGNLWIVARASNPKRKM